MIDMHVTYDDATGLYHSHINGKYVETYRKYELENLATELESLMLDKSVRAITNKLAGDLLPEYLHGLMEVIYGVLGD